MGRADAAFAARVIAALFDELGQAKVCEPRRQAGGAPCETLGENLARSVRSPRP